MSGGVRSFNALVLLTGFGLAFTAAGCFSVGDNVVGEGETAGDGDGDPSDGDPTTGDGDPTTGDGDPTAGDGDPTTGDGDPTAGCDVGTQGCPCTGGGGCDPGLVCEGGVCVPMSGDGDPSTTGDGDPDSVCVGDSFIEIDIIEDAAEIVGWVPTMSMIGEGTVLAWDNENTNAYVTWSLDIPCDDTWHVWVRAIDQSNNDSFFASVDGQPQPPAIFEIDCTSGPNQATYTWRELNWRQQGTPACEYLHDPWVQEWTQGVHSLRLSYRESYAISRVWLTNTNQPPPS
jgi:hypothetical protein